MAANRKVTGKAAALPVGIGIGVLASLAVTLLGSALAAYLIHSEKIGENTIGGSAMVILAAASVIGALVACQRVKRMRVQVSMITGAAYYITLLAMTALLFGGQYDGMGVTALVVLAGCGVSALLGVRGGKGRKMRGLKRSYR